jgi:hypothetical protein
MVRREHVFVLTWGLAVLLAIVKLSPGDAPLPVVLSLIALLPRPSCFAHGFRPEQGVAVEPHDKRPQGPNASEAIGSRGQRSPNA